MEWLAFRCEALWLQSAVLPPGEAETVLAERLSHFLELRRQWLSIAGDQAAAVMRLGQAVLQLELSRYTHAGCTFQVAGYCGVLKSPPIGHMQTPVRILSYLAGWQQLLNGAR